MIQSWYEIFFDGFFVGVTLISCIQYIRRWAQEKARKRGWGFYASDGNFVWKDEK